jgi:hypothetical protein
MIRKLLLVGLIVFILPNTAMQMAVGTIIALGMIVLNATFTPNADPDDDRLNIACSIAVWAGYFGGFMLAFRKYECCGEPDCQFCLGGDAFGLVLVGINLFPLFVGLYLLGKVFMQPAFRLLKKMWNAQKNKKKRTTAASSRDVLDGLNRGDSMARISIKNKESQQTNPMMEGSLPIGKPNR